MNIRKKVWKILSRIYPWYLRKRYGMDIGEGVRISYKAKLDKSINPKGVHIGDNTWVLANSVILAHDYCRGKNRVGKYFDTYIGCDCVIGINAIILPGVRIGDQSIIAAGAVVTKDIPCKTIAAGNPAKVVKSDINIMNGQIVITE